MTPREFNAAADFMRMPYSSKTRAALELVMCEGWAYNRAAFAVGLKNGGALHKAEASMLRTVERLDVWCRAKSAIC